MKKTTTLILGFFLSFALTAQINPIKISKQLDKAEKNKVIRSGDEALSNLMVNPNLIRFTQVIPKIQLKLILMD